jgi:hypothetical protein
MKSTAWILAAILILSGLSGAQWLSSSRIATQVPFEFVVANKIVPPGQYVMQSATMGNTILSLRSTSSKVNIFLPVSQDELRKPAGAYALVFKQYGDRYFLSALKLQGSKIVYRLPQSKAEAELRAQNVPGREKILLASLR